MTRAASGSSKPRRTAAQIPPHFSERMFPWNHLAVRGSQGEHTPISRSKYLHNDESIVPMNSIALWKNPPSNTLVLLGGEVHVWRAQLNVSELRLPILQETLGPDENERAGRFYFSKDRRRFVAARGLLRIILSRYMGVAASSLRFRYNRFGKPALDCDHSDMLHFNVSYSDALALYALALDRQVGIDLERIRIVPHPISIAQRFFSTAEVSRLRRLPEHIQNEALLRYWTRKEAYAKATGLGLSTLAGQSDMSVALSRLERDRHGSSGWSIYELNPDPGYVACVAVEGCAERLMLWRWSE